MLSSSSDVLVAVFPQWLAKAEEGQNTLPLPIPVRPAPMPQSELRIPQWPQIPKAPAGPLGAQAPEAEAEESEELRGHLAPATVGKSMLNKNTCSKNHIREAGEFWRVTMTALAYVPFKRAKSWVKGSGISFVSCCCQCFEVFFPIRGPV